RRRAALLAVGAVAARGPPAHRRDLRPRLADPRAPRTGSLALRPARRLRGRAGGDLPGAGVAARTGRAAAPAGPHGAALAVPDGRAPAALARGAPVSVTARPAPADPHLLGRAPPSLPGPPPGLRGGDAPRPGAAALRRRHLALARPRALRTRPALRRLA